MSRVASIQLTSGMSVEKNLQQAEKFIKQAAAENAQLVVLPECFAFMGKEDTDSIGVRESLGTGPIQNFLAAQSAQHKIWIIGGTIPLISPDPNKVFNACLVYDDQGKQVARYNKIHLFDAQLKAGREIYQESKTVEPGKQVVVLDTPFGRLGLAICYDIRFPELFRSLANQGAEIFVIPTAFTKKTGQAHWEVLVRARAIENFCYLISSCQTGKHENGRSTYGHSLIVDPWGTILAQLPNACGVVTADISLEKLHQIRADFPVHEHRKLSLF